MNRIELSLPTKHDYVSLARLTIASVANNMGFSIGDVEDLKVAVSEACANAISFSMTTETTYDLTYSVGEKDLTITVKDTGEGFEPDMLLKRPDNIGDPLGSGFGLFIIKSLMDNVEIVSEKGIGTSITMVKNLPTVYKM
ncbi:ATP-binding protein [Acetobacterium bakii]|uniref:Histidine kinase n=1 Tax=Acetobacterium bakii TaxID=52689 RepID=A0A0L6TYL1_9FIRM|nr:ATP-binding protein [Acetobacterium bakii]KNZ41339.1 histidine kinase [Acetobacterium bakii]